MQVSNQPSTSRESGVGGVELGNEAPAGVLAAARGKHRNPWFTGHKACASCAHFIATQQCAHHRCDRPPATPPHMAMHSAAFEVLVTTRTALPLYKGSTSLSASSVKVSAGCNTSCHGTLGAGGNGGARQGR